MKTWLRKLIASMRANPRAASDIAGAVFLLLAFALAALILLSLGGCATERYHTDNRPTVDAVQPLALPDIPAAEQIMCPRGHWDRLAICPWGEKFAAYSPAQINTLTEFRIAARANTQIAADNADTAQQLDAEAAAANKTAGTLEAEVGAANRRLFMERLGWLGSLALIIGLAL